MLFSSISFLYYFLPFVMVLYFIVPAQWKNAVLLGSSLVFYGWGEPKLVFLMLITIIAGYFMGRLTEKNSARRRLYLAIALVFDLGVLAYFKYADFFIENINMVTGLSLPLLKIALPIGISFYTFQMMSYNIDVYRGQVAAQKNLIHLATYITMFPQLIAGPIVRYKDIEGKLAKRTHTLDKIASGIERFAVGLAKKVILANSYGELCAAFQKSGDLSVLYYWMYAFAFSLQIYFDFSGYSDMAIGLGKIFGFDFAENFNYPYISKSITEFWRRWHISLGSWFKDYVYIPLGGSRVKPGRRYFNIFAVWMLTGLWHGASWNFVIWGLYFAVLLIFEKMYLLQFLEKSKVLGRVYVVVLVVVSFVIFDAASMGNAIQCLKSMLGLSSGLAIISAEAVYYLKSYGVLFVIGVIGLTPAAKIILSKMLSEKSRMILEPVMILVLLATATAYLVDGSFNPFLYFRF